MWWVFALFSALASLFRNIIMKDLGNKLDEYINVLGRFIFILPFALGLTLYKSLPHVTTIYWLYAALAGLCVSVSTIYLSKAFKFSHLSLTATI